jgi:hypothetical protein
MAQGADEQEGGYYQDGATQEFRPPAELRAAAEEADEAPCDHQEMTSGSDQNEQQGGVGQMPGAHGRPESFGSCGDEPRREQVGGIPGEGDREPAPKPQTLFRRASTITAT